MARSDRCLSPRSEVATSWGDFPAYVLLAAVTYDAIARQRAFEAAQPAQEPWVTSRVAATAGPSRPRSPGGREPPATSRGGATKRAVLSEREE